jgi:hypothetical protein
MRSWSRGPAPAVPSGVIVDHHFNSPRRTELDLSAGSDNGVAHHYRRPRKILPSPQPGTLGDSQWMRCDFIPTSVVDVAAHRVALHAWFRPVWRHDHFSVLFMASLSSSITIS